MNLVFFGSGAFGVPTLERLSREHAVALIVTQPDRPAGRGKALTPTPVGAFAADRLAGVPIVKPQNVNDPEVVERIRGTPADAWVVIAFGQKLGRGLLADRFAINLHASLLPRWRGAAPINHAILAGDDITGNSVITLADRMDAGLVLGQSTRPIDPLVTAGELHDLLASDGPELVLRVLNQHASGTLQPVAQDESAVTLAGKLAKADGALEFCAPADEIRCRIHGLNPWPGVTALFRGQPLKLLRVRARDGDSSPAHAVPWPVGVIVDGAAGRVSCGSGTTLELLEVQPAGGRAMAWADFARGQRVQSGERLEGGGL